MLYSRNLINFLQLILKNGELTIDRADEILVGSCVAFGGRIVNERAAAAAQQIAVG